MTMDRRGFLTGAAALSAAGLFTYAGTATAHARPATTLGTQDWMAGLGDGAALSSLTIPGTHDSGARFGGPWTECQNTTIAEQLASGIRFLDVRCRAIDGSFAIHHGASYQELMFGDVLIACRDFLAAHPSETVLMRVKQEYSEVADAEFGAVFTDYLDVRGWRSLFAIGDALPSLGQARGKVVLIADNGGLPGGVRWGDTSVFSLQDEYMAEPFAKWPKIEAHFRKAATEPGPFYINFVSTAAGLPPRWNADRLNPQVHDLLDSAEGAGWRGLGIVPMDYPNTRSGLVDSLIRHNGA
ncbi:phosphatidylinositol-specific phospholipase C [Streptomyces boluensis]|uniref:1-phosphatidylinositol phosphodiesterase n=1 Tax=Streptomyces boluensis TaxID=1775135 RepID=A0A964XKA2_9ACTN|nr:phosphatidylinositol-specific phospholipase C [Streptomyces boluensis]NBE50333.1 phosphatidylinositol-specific phospholipase C domain-containing protein [Streptomyces boluensis]